MLAQNTNVRDSKKENSAKIIPPLRIEPGTSYVLPDTLQSELTWQLLVEGSLI